MKYILLCILITSAQGALLDKIYGVFNEEVITKSEIDRALSNFKSRAVIAPVIYDKQKYTPKQMLNQDINIRTIRTHLATIGIVVDDEQVERTIESFLSSRSSTRRELEDTLEQQGLTYNEYFELIRISREFNALMKYVVEPLVSISEQQIKNEFFRRNAENQTLTIQYNLIVYQVPERVFKKIGKEKFISGLRNYQNTGILAPEVKETQEIDLGKVSEDDLAKEVIRILKRTDEGEFSSPIQDAKLVRTYFIRKKDLTETSIYLRSKNALRGAIFEKEARRVLGVWLDTERQKHFVKYNL